MSLLTALRSALRALTTHTLRSLLTMLGIIIGVAAVITMIAIGNGAQQRVAEQIRSVGANAMFIDNGVQRVSGTRLGAGTAQSLSEGDAAALTAEVPEIAYAAPTMRSQQQVIRGNGNWITSVLGTTNEYLGAREWVLASGRAFEPLEQSRAGKVALIGQTAARELFGDEDPVDQVIRVRRVPLTVIGVLAPKGQNAMGQDQDDVVIVPISTYRYRIQGWGGGRQLRVHGISVKVAEGEDMSAAESRIREVLRERRRQANEDEDSFNVRNLTEMMNAQAESGRVFTLLLAAVAGVSLVVGGIGIMNIMLVSVTERTREIGLRMAVGARGRDILAQFLIEALVLSLLGGAIGVLLGAGATWAVASLADWPVLLSPQAIGLAVGFSAAIGIFFGFYPARRAASLLPIQALRHE